MSIDSPEEAKFEDPRKTHPLPGLTATRAEEAEGSRPETWTDQSGLRRWFQENWLGTLTKEHQNKVRFHYTTLANTFLRDIPLTTRARIVACLTRITKYYLDWERRPGAAHAEHHPLFGSAIHLDRSSPDESEAMHEGMHVLQQEGHLPFNHSLTYAITAVANLAQGRIDFLKEGEDSPGTFKKEFLNRRTYFQLVKEGRAHEAFTSGWMLHPRKDNDCREFELYLGREKAFEQEFAAYGELIENRFGVRQPYGIMMNVGLARGERAYAIGLLSGNLDNAWSVLYLHARGMPFEDAEKTVVAAIESGQEKKLVDFRPLKAGQVERLAAYEEVYGSRKLWEEKFPRTIRPLVRKLRCAKDLVSEYGLALKQSLEKVSEEELRQRYQLFSSWLEEKKENGSVNLSRISHQAEALLNRSLDIGQEAGANLFLLPDKEGELNLSMAGVRLGQTLGPMSFVRPRVYSRVFAEQLGTVHTHPFYDAPPSVPDLVNLALNDREAFQAIRSADTLYLVVKPLETALENSSLSRFQKMAIRRKEIVRALTQLSRPGSDRKKMMVQAAERLGLKIYRADSPEYASFSRRIGLSAQPSPDYRVTGIV